MYTLFLTPPPKREKVKSVMSGDLGGHGISPPHV